MKVEPFKVEHLRRMDVQEAQRYLLPHVNWEHLRHLEHPQWSHTALEGDHVFACYGTVPLAGSRAVAWAYLSDDAGRKMVGLVRAMRSFLQATPFRRIEAFVDADFSAGHRMIRLLGFELETPRKRAHRVDGGDSSEYVLLR